MNKLMKGSVAVGFNVSHAMRRIKIYFSFCKMTLEKINYLPFKFGGFSLFSSDINYDHQLFEPFGFKNWLNDTQSSSLPERPKNEKEIIFYLYNPRFIHQFSGKWKDGNGLSIYRLLAKYFILLAGISYELCKKNKGYCQ